MVALVPLDKSPDHQGTPTGETAERAARAARPVSGAIPASTMVVPQAWPAMRVSVAPAAPVVPEAPVTVV